MADFHRLSAMKASIQKLANDVQDAQKDLTAAMQRMSGLRSQLTENKLVQEELQQLEDGSKVFKLVGPILIAQDTNEACTTVETRMQYIMKELETAEARVKNLEASQQELRLSLLEEQNKFQTLVQQSQTRSALANS